MPSVRCPKCGNSQLVPREMVGLAVDCGQCGKSFMTGGGTRTRRVQVAEGEPIDWRTILKAGGLLTALVVVVGIVFAVAAFAINKRSEKATPATTPATAPAVAPAPTEPVDQWRAAGPGRQPWGDPLDFEPDRKPVMETSRDNSIETLAQTAVAAGGLVAFVAAMFIIVYGAAVLLTGGWVARDASNRGMSGIGWAAFYFLFQAFWRVPLFVVALFPSVVIAGLGVPLVLIGFAELASWAGLGSYLIARRRGPMSRCGTCHNSALAYLPSCPHCQAGT